MRGVRTNSALIGLTLVLAFACGASLVGCANDGETQVVPPVVLGMLETTPPT